MSNDNIPIQLSLFDVEVWKHVVGYEDYYAVSNHGRVMRLKKGTGVREDFHILLPSADKYGYLRVKLSRHSKNITQQIHRLVARAFIGERPQGMVVNHIDGVKTNNRLSNLEYVTPRENTQHAIRLGLITFASHRGERHPMSKLTLAQVKEIRALYKRGGITQREISERYGVSAATISVIVLNKVWRY